MILPQSFFNKLQENDISFFAGVPDSLLKYICAYITNTVPSHQHVICANEGGAVALGIGYHLSTGRIPLIYLQNSGLGNAINPLLSLASQEIYSIPMILLIGWRGEPGTKDEPQHITQGRVMLPMLETMQIPYQILDYNFEKASYQINESIQSAKIANYPYALIVRKDTFSEYRLLQDEESKWILTREEAIQHIIDELCETDVLVSTTGMTSREVYEYRVAGESNHGHDFLTVGGMGHASQIALGIALQAKDRQIFCIDGDGAAIMHLGAFAIIGTKVCDNYKHILINNGAHDSVGGQPTAGFDIDFQKVALALGYKEIFSASYLEEIKISMKKLRNSKGPGLLEIKVRKGFRDDLGRPAKTPLDNKMQFMQFLQESLHQQIKN